MPCYTLKWRICHACDILSSSVHFWCATFPQNCSNRPSLCNAQKKCGWRRTCCWSLWNLEFQKSQIRCPTWNLMYAPHSPVLLIFYVGQGHLCLPQFHKQRCRRLWPDSVCCMPYPSEQQLDKNRHCSFLIGIIWLCQGSFLIHLNTNTYNFLYTKAMNLPINTITRKHWV